MAEHAVGGVVTVLQPLQVALHGAGGVAGDHAVLAHVHPVLETKLVGHLPLGTFAQTHSSLQNFSS